jgi:hypothetical protein
MDEQDGEISVALLVAGHEYAAATSALGGIADPALECWVGGLGWSDSEMCRQGRLIWRPSFCWHRRRCLRGFVLV